MTLSKIPFSGGLKKILKMFYPPKGAAKAVPYGVHLTSFLFNNRLGNDFDTSKIPFSGGLFFLLEMFYLRMGWDGMGWDGMDGVSKVSFNFLHTLWVYT